MDAIRLYKKLDAYSRYASWAGGATILLIAIVITIAALLRKFTSVSTGDVTEIVGYLFAVAGAFGLSFVFIRRQNIRIDTAYNLLPRRVTAVLDVLASFAFFLTAAYLAYAAVETLVRSWVNDSVSITSLATPLWIPQLFWALGLVLLFVVTGFVFGLALVSLLRGRKDLVGRVAGMPSLEEEVHEFTGAAVDAAGEARNS